MKLRQIETKTIRRNKKNPRGIDIAHEDKKLAMLIDSVVDYGIMVPLVVADKGDYYMLIDGERRFEAAKAIELKKVPAYVFEDKVSSSDVLLCMFHIHHNREQWGPIQQCSALEVLYNKFIKTSTYRDLTDEWEKIELATKFVEQKTGIDHRTARSRILFLRWPVDIKKELYRNPSDAHTYIVEIEEGVILPVIKNYSEYFDGKSVDLVRSSLFKKYAVNAAFKGISVRVASPIFKFETYKSRDRSKILGILDNLINDTHMTYREAREEFDQKFPNARHIAPLSPRKLVNLLNSTCEKIDSFDISSISKSRGRSKATKKELLGSADKLKKSIEDLQDLLE